MIEAGYAVIGVLGLMLTGAVLTVWVQCRHELAEHADADRESVNERDGWKP